MSNITINPKSRTIEMTKTFAAAASIYGTAEYDELQGARRDYPTYRVVAVSKKASKSEYKGLTYEYMERYITAHDDEEKSRMATFKMLRGTSEEGMEAVAGSASYAEIKEWFLMTYPAIEKFHSDRDALLKEIAERRAARKAA